MATKTVILHGWSDCSASFKNIKAVLDAEGLGPASAILFADYESREDDLTFNDAIDGLNDEFIRLGIIDRNGKARADLNVIVHSTGGLVIRHWIAWFYAMRGRMADCPVKRIVMLAPANFGSPLAHRGKSFLGSLVKGRWKVGDLLEVGRLFLDGLELGSPFQWWLAHQDLLLEKPLYSAAGIQVTVLVGINDYTGLRGWVNKPGTDGTVVIAGTSIDSARLVLDFCNPSPEKAYHWATVHPPSEFGFGVLEGHDHGSIVSAAGTRQTEVSDLLLRALRVQRPAEFRSLAEDLHKITDATYANSNPPGGVRRRYQQFILHAVDDFGVSIRDFTIEFYALRSKRMDAHVADDKRLNGKERYWSEKFNRIMLDEVHTHTIDSSYRRLLVDIHELTDMAERARLDMGEGVVVGMRIYVPPINRGIQYDLSCMQNIVIYDPAARSETFSFFYENTTTLLELRVNRLSIGHVSVQLAPRRH